MGGVAKRTHTSVDDLVLDHLVSRSGRPVFVNPVWLVPMVVRDQTKVNRSIRQDLHPSTSSTHKDHHRQRTDETSNKHRVGVIRGREERERSLTT